MKNEKRHVAEETHALVRSKDGTLISYQKSGGGRPLLLVGGGLDDGSENLPLAKALSNDFTVYNYARRGRGASGNTLPYAVQREVEDIQALMGVAGEGVGVFGISSGGALALIAASYGLPIAKLAVYEVPYITDDNLAQSWRNYTSALHRLLQNHQLAEAVELFMRFAGSGDDSIAAAKESDFWWPLTRLAHTLAYDAACLGDGRPPKEISRITRPVLILTGRSVGHSAGMEGLDLAFFDKAAKSISALLPHALRTTVANESHIPDSDKITTILANFFKE